MTIDPTSLIPRQNESDEVALARIEAELSALDSRHLSAVPDSSPDIDVDELRNALSGIAEAEELDPVDALSELRTQRFPCSKAAYTKAYERAGKPKLSDHACRYQVKRAIDPQVALRRGVYDAAGAGNLPDPGEHREFSLKVRNAANAPHEFLVNPWHLPNGEKVPQLRWLPTPRVEGSGESEREVKFDFPLSSRNANAEEVSRVVDTLHAKPFHDVHVIAEGLAKADCVASFAPTLSIIAIPGADGAAIGRRNPVNLSDTVSSVIDELVEAVGGIEDKHFILTPDADFTVHPGVHQAFRVRLGGALLRAGAAQVRIAIVPRRFEDPVSGETVDLTDSAGIDDWLRARAEHSSHEDGLLGALLAESLPHAEALRRWREYENTDAGRGSRLADEIIHRGGAYIPASKSWRWWTGTHMAHDKRGGHVRALAAELSDRAWGKNKAETLKERAAGRSRNSINACVELASTHAGIWGSTADWQPRQYAHYWPASNGTVDLDTGFLDENRWYREHKNPFAGPVAYVPGAQSAAWDEYRRKIFLKKVGAEKVDSSGTYLHANGNRYPYELDKDGTRFEYDGDLEMMFQMCVGSWYYSRGFRIGLICKGAGQSGLGTMVSAILATMGRDAHTTMRADALASKANQFTTSSLPNARVVIPSEMQGSWVLDESTWRLLTQDADLVTVEPKGQDLYDTQVTWSLVIMTNELPRLAMTSNVHNGNRSRAVVAEFPRGVRDEDKDSRWEEDLMTPEAQESILAWAIEGSKMLAANGHKVAKTGRCIELVNEWLGRSDRLGGFIEDALEESKETLHQDAGVPVLTKPNAWRIYNEWCREEGISVAYRMKKQAFFAELAGRPAFGPAKRLKRTGVDGQLTNGSEGWCHWKVRPDWSRDQFGGL